MTCKRNRKEIEMGALRTDGGGDGLAVAHLIQFLVGIPSTIITFY